MMAPARESATPAVLAAEAVRVRLGMGAPVLENLTFRIPRGSVTAIVGPNACGKSTLLRTLARVIEPESGSITLDGADVRGRPRRDFAKRVALLAQDAVAPDGIRVRDLVGRGRHPHRTMFQQWTPEDDDVVDRVMDVVRVRDLGGRLVQQLSGGQRQRVRIAMALAQETDVLLLDEPTTALDIEHQYEVLDLCSSLNTEHGTTIVAVLHDLGQAARYADRIVAMRNGQIVADGTPREVVTSSVVRSVFGIDCVIADDPVTGTPSVFPISARRAAGSPGPRRPALSPPERS